MQQRLFFTAVAFKNEAGVVQAEPGFLTATNIMEAEGLANRQFRQQFPDKQVLHIQCMDAEAAMQAAQNAAAQANKQANGDDAVKKPTARNVRRLEKKEAAKQTAKPAAKKGK